MTVIKSGPRGEWKTSTQVYCPVCGKRLVTKNGVSSMGGGSWKHGACESKQR